MCLYHENENRFFLTVSKHNLILQEEGFAPGGGSLHSMMTPHGPDKDCFEKASQGELKPQRVADGTMVCTLCYFIRLTQLS